MSLSSSEFEPETYNFVRSLHHPSKRIRQHVLTNPSQVQAAITSGYSVFFYDRLGCGLSTKLSGFENQLSTGIATLQGLAAELREGKYTGSIGVPEKLALMGFSYGSYITFASKFDQRPLR